MKKIIPLLLFGTLTFATAAHSEIVTEVTDYELDGATLEGTVVYDDSATEPRPAVIIYHQWSGAGDYELSRARMLAEQGYVAFVADVYGKGVRPATFDERRALVTAYIGDRPMMRARARAALDTVRQNPHVKPDAIAAIGYCFGGIVVLELARDGADIDAAVSIHGGLNTPNPGDAANIKAVILAQHGGDDPHVPAEELAAFRKEMTDANVNATVTIYEGAVHAFTDKNAGDDPSTGAAYNEAADKASWTELVGFLSEHVK